MHLAVVDIHTVERRVRNNDNDNDNDNDNNINNNQQVLTQAFPWFA